eukprot:230743_1
MDSTKSNSEALEEQIQTLEGFQEFQTFLENEFSEENLLFIQACDEFREMCKTGTKFNAKWQAAVQLWKGFIHDEGGHQVNLPAAVTDKITRRMAFLLLEFERREKLKKEQRYQSLRGRVSRRIGSVSTVFNRKAKPKNSSGEDDEDPESDDADLTHEQVFRLLFVRARREVFQLVASDTFPRFRKAKLNGETTSPNYRR